MTDVLRTAVVGCGGLGRRQAQIASNAEGVELVAVSDVNAESAKAVAAENNVGAAVYTDHRKMLAQVELDCLQVVAPTYTHERITVDAANAGVHIFCEKPMAITLDECDRMIEAAEKNQVLLMLGFVRRFQPSYSEIKRRVDAGDIGQVRLVQSVRMGGRPPAGIADWRRESKKVGGLHSAYIHEMDQMLWIGGHVKTVRGVVNFGTFPDTDVEDSIWMCLEFQNGAIGAMGSSQVYPIGWYDLSVGGTEGCMKVDGTTSVILRPHDGKAEKIELSPNDAMEVELHYFFDCVKNREQPSVTGLDGRKSLEVVLAAFKSAETKEVITLPL